MTVYVPGWLQGGSYSAQHDRINSRAADWDEGVDTRASLKVTQRAAGANMTVDIAAGGCVVQGDDTALQGNYDVFSDAVTNLGGFVATSANTRYDIVVMQVNDPTAGGAAGNNAVITRVAGTQAASPVIPTIPNSALLLAIVGPFTTSTSSITNSMIHDAYTGTGPTGVTGARLCKGFRDTPGTTKEQYNPIAPNGWLIEAGQAISRTTYAALFEHFGTAFGSGDGSTTFNIPDSRGRVLVALDNQGGSDAGRLAAANTLGGTGGEELHALTIAELAAHDHPGSTVDPATVNAKGFSTNNATIPDNSGSSSTGAAAGSALGSIVTVDIPSTSVTVASQGSGTAHNNMQPYILGYRIVRT